MPAQRRRAIFISIGLSAFLAFLLPAPAKPAEGNLVPSRKVWSTPRLTGPLPSVPLKLPVAGSRLTPQQLKYGLSAQAPGRVALPAKGAAPGLRALKEAQGAAGAADAEGESGRQLTFSFYNQVFDGEAPKTEEPVEGAGESAQAPAYAPALLEKLPGIASRYLLEYNQRTLAEGLELQSWGIPDVISVKSNYEPQKPLRYAHLYRMNGMPTELGLLLHEAMSPLVKADPAFLSRVTKGQLHAAVQLLYESLAYRMKLDPEQMPVPALMQFRSQFSEGFDYPHWRKAYLKSAVSELRGRPLGGDRKAGLGRKSEARRPTLVLLNILGATAGRLEKQLAMKAPESEIEKSVELLEALHAVTGLPVMTGPDQAALLPVRHAQLPPLMRELARRRVPEEVQRAVMRAYPLGESLWRMRVHELWARGITGKGVKIAVVDNGVDFNHPDLSNAGTVSVNLTRDRDDHTKGDHGTAVASIIHAIAPDAEIQSYQALSHEQSPPFVALNAAETNDAIVRALGRAQAHGVDLVNMSAGLSGGHATDFMARKVSRLAKAGVVFVTSAGNAGLELPPDLQIDTPASAPEAIEVGAVDYHLKKELFSSRGKVPNHKDHTFTEKPGRYSFGRNIKAAQQLPAHLYDDEPLPYDYISGTSFGAPHVTGVAALMLQAGKEAKSRLRGAAVAAAVREALDSSAAVVKDPEEGDDLRVVDNAPRAVRAYLKEINSRRR